MGTVWRVERPGSGEMGRLTTGMGEVGMSSLLEMLKVWPQVKTMVTYVDMMLG